MKAKVPQQVEYSAQKFPVSYEKYMRVDDHVTGCFNHRTQEIRVDPDEVKAQKNVTFLHENIEIINIKYKLGMEEDNVERLANGLMEMFKNLQIELDWSDIK